MNGLVFVSEKIQQLLSEAAKGSNRLQPPVNLFDLAKLCRVVGIEQRPMVPEGVLTPVPGGFKIYLQSNFVHRPGADLRQRFTLAHELVHTFYYDTAVGVPKRIARSPKGSALERLCHAGAGQMLVPDALLREWAQAVGEIATAESILDVASASAFEVSAEVLVRRLHEVERAAAYEFAAILVDVGSSGRREIRAACFSPLLLCHTPPPKFGLDFDSWVTPLMAPSTTPDTLEWTHSVRSSRVSARKVYRSNRSFILDLRFDGAAS